MNCFEKYVNSIIINIECSKESKEDLRLQFLDHLTSLKMEYDEKGYDEDTAIQLSIKDFGKNKNIIDDFKSTHYIKKNRFRFLSITFLSLYILFILLTLLNPRSTTAVWVMLARQNGGYLGVTINIIPFKTILHYSEQLYRNGFLTFLHNTLYQIVLFIPFGILIPFIFSKYENPLAFLKLSIFVIVSIEILRSILPLGVADIDHIILHTIGANLGLFIYILIFKFASKSKTSKAQGNDFS